MIVVSPAAAQPSAGEVYVACSSSVGSSYSGVGRKLNWAAHVTVADVVKTGVPADDKLRSVVLDRFTKWVRATGQFGRWNSVWDDKIDCSLTDAGYPQRRPRGEDADWVWRDASLPSDWYRRVPSDPKEISRYSTGKPVAGSGVANEGTLTVMTASPPIEPGWDAKVRDQQRKDAANRIRAAAGTEKMRQETQAALTKLFAEMKKRGSAQ